LKPGTTTIVSGFPLTGLVASSMSVTAGTVSATAGPRDDSRLFQISAPVQPGNSGGPVLDAEGHVTGIVTSALNGTLLALIAGITPQNVNFAIKSVIVRNFLAAQDVDIAHASGGRERSTVEVGAQARRFTVRIECGSPATAR
jgi:S1-C subfamily serine protease